ncbi:MAG: type II toxin-antitoxin system RelE/ParE family toxin [Alphaproteobacteria bacterium]|nr:peptidase [Rhodospirillaceae bacterium]MBT7612583.1 peptidase [Rhodospirillaceae bacterium]MDG2482896.1 type II toxin-antitoxin system RelE/ParE family toxin [Alphaproteobacteria bacterium]
MIASFCHKGLRRLYEKDDQRRLPPDQVERLRRILARLDIAASPEDMDLPGWRLHQLRGDLLGFWAVDVSGNWRVIFRMEHGNVSDLDLIDYH